MAQVVYPGRHQRIGLTASWLVPLSWFSVISLVAFLVPYVFSSVLDLQHDLYYLIYFSITLGILAVFIRSTGADIPKVAMDHWKLSLAVGAVSTAFVVWSVLAKVDSTPRPHGAYFVFELAWRGVFYGAVDALLLSAMPGLVARQMLGNSLRGFTRRVEYGVLTLLLVVVVTSIYHLGYEGLRNREGITNPEIGNAVISLPVIVSANPLGSIAAHASMHVTAVTHSYESDDRLPPQTFVED